MREPHTPSPPGQPLRSPDGWAPLLAHLQAGLLEREDAAHLLLLGALAGEHSLLLGPPGSAKSELARRLQRCFAGTRYVERLLTRFTTPEELFGPLSLKALEDDRYERLVEGFLPTAGIAFLDEVFKAHSAILNTLLGLLNERVFDNGTQRLAVPLISLVGASNEWPDDEGLAAFRDRFLLCIPVAPVSDEGFAALLALPGGDGIPSAVPCPVTPAEQQALRARASQIGLEPSATAGMVALRAWLAAQQRTLSDRRWRQWLRLMRVAAAADGRETVDALDLWTAPAVAAASGLGHEALQAWVQHTLLQATAQPFTGLHRATEAFEAQLDLEASRPAVSGLDDDAGKMALARGLTPEDSGGEPLRIRARALEVQDRRRYSATHIAARLAELGALQALVDARHADARARLETLQQALASRHWPPPGRSARWCEALAQNVGTLDALRGRLDRVAAGFAALPTEDRDGTPPPPVLDPRALQAEVA
jgi:MoxR-like ATPase